jgi:hypothetical protein
MGLVYSQPTRKNNTITGKEFNEKYPIKMWKCLRKDFTHHNFTFQNGLNELKEIFEEKKGKGGFHFTSRITHWLHLGELIVPVIIPDDATVFVYNDNKTFKSKSFKTNKLLLDLTQAKVPEDYLDEIIDNERLHMNNMLKYDDDAYFSILTYIDLDLKTKKVKCFIYEYSLNPFPVILKTLFQKIFSIYPNLIEYAIGLSEYYYFCILNPTPEHQLICIKKYPFMIKYIEPPTLEMLTIVVNQLIRDVQIKNSGSSKSNFGNLYDNQNLETLRNYGTSQ